MDKLPWFNLVQQKSPETEQELIEMKIDYLKLQAQQLQLESKLIVREEYIRRMMEKRRK
jgi:hypothetical protein